jgi:hypothetical protein
MGPVEHNPVVECQHCKAARQYLMAVAQHLKSVGHNVTFNTSVNFRGKVASIGIRFVAMTGKANFDYRHPMICRSAGIYLMRIEKSIC